jgi:hypothetical protein
VVSVNVTGRSFQPPRHTHATKDRVLRQKLAQPAGFCHIRRWMNWPASPQTQCYSILLGVPDAGHHISYPESFPRPKPFWIRLLRGRHGLQNAWHVSFSTDRPPVSPSLLRVCSVRQSLNPVRAWRCCISVTLTVSFSSVKESQAFSPVYHYTLVPCPLRVDCCCS